MFPTLATYIADLNIDQVDSERKETLRTLARFIREKNGSPANLVYICTHNSRRSHFGQIWGKVMAEFYGIPNVHTFSGGTEATAFHPNAIRAAQATGLSINPTGEKKNPLYEIRYDGEKKAIRAFSKKYEDPSNPQSDFCAIMTCTDADENCPVIYGATLRIATPYEDPKRYDGTSKEREMYAERCRQIAVEMAFVMREV